MTTADYYDIYTDKTFYSQQQQCIRHQFDWHLFLYSLTYLPTAYKINSLLAGAQLRLEHQTRIYLFRGLLFFNNLVSEVKTST